MKIAIVGPAHPYKGGMAQHTTTLAHRLSAVGHDVVLASWRAQYPRFLYPGQLTVAEPEVALYPGMRICSFTFEQLSSRVAVPYRKKAGNKYAGQDRPLASKLASETGSKTS